MVRSNVFDTIFLLFFSLLILSSTFDKFGVLIELGSNTISLPVYKVIFIAILLLYLIDFFTIHSSPNNVEIDLVLYRLIFGFVAVQTIASLIGGIITPGAVPISSEIFYFIQRSSFLFIPLFALRCNMSPKKLLALFSGAILIHLLAICFQFLFPDAYISFVQSFYNPIRPDNTLLWDGSSLAFLGLQRTSNYGVFVASFGLLMLGFTPVSLSGRLLVWMSAILSVFFAAFGYSRACILMVMTVLIVNSWRHMRHLTYVKSFVMAMLFSFVLLLSLTDSIGIVIPLFENVPSIEAFFSPEKVGSTLGKIRIIEIATDLFLQSPIVGWGQKKFMATSFLYGNYSQGLSETHSFILSTIITTGLIGLIAYIVLFIWITKALWQKMSKDYVIVCSMFIGLGLYNIVYDAGALDVFVCFNGIAAYFALQSAQPKHSDSLVTTKDHGRPKT